MLQPPPRVGLITRLQRADSGSEAFLALASDNNEYWVKAPDNPQGSRTLVAEVIVYGIGHAIGAPVPPNVLIEIPSGFPLSYKDGRVINAGTGHGSLNIVDVVESDDWGTYSKRDDNRSRQAFILALWDLCMGVDPQWLHQITSDYSMWSFDHGLWLAGEADWDIPSLQGIGIDPWLYSIDSGVASAHALNDAANRVGQLTLQTFQTITGFVPLQWETSTSELQELAVLLHQRVSGVVGRLRAAAQQSVFP